MLPTSVSGLRDHFQYAHTDAGRTTWAIGAHKVTQEQGSNQVHLDQVELKIYNKTGDEYNLVKCANAEFDQADSRMYSEGEVEITLRVPVKRQPARPLTKIKSSGVRFDVKTDAPQVKLDQLLELTDRYCVIFQTIQNSPKTTVKLNRVGQ